MKLSYPKFWQTKNFISYLLWPLSQVYFLMGIIRKLITKPIRLPAKVICVGNISVGGTGKTQLIVWLAELLKADNINFVIITKAYGSKLQKAVLVTKDHTSKQIGDESVLLSKYGPVIAAKKIHYTLDIINLLKPQVILADDGMQNPGFYKDFTFVVIDAHRWFGNGFLIPAGPLRQYFDITQDVNKPSNFMPVILNANREPISNFSNSIENDKLIHRIKLSSFIATIKPSVNLDKAIRYFAFCGIGNPERFFITLYSAGFKIVEQRIFPDHHNYSIEDLNNLQQYAQQLNATLVTTRKDYIKICEILPLEKRSNIKCLDVKLTIDNHQQLKHLIYAKIF